MSINNPYYYHPQPSVLLAADDVFLHITKHPAWQELFEQGKMLGVLVVKADSSIHARTHIINNICYLAAYSGVVNGLEDTEEYFVPPIYDLQKPDDFYLQKDEEITLINKRIIEIEARVHDTDKILLKEMAMLKAQRHQMSIALQKEIFSHFNICNSQRQYKNVIDVFADAKRGLPPGGTGECAAPRLLQYAFEHGLSPLALAEFWYGRTPKQQLRIHGRFYPSCIEKCSPLLHYMIPMDLPIAPDSDTATIPAIIYEDDYLIAVHKPAGFLSVPSKDLSAPNIEQWLHALYPHVKGPMLVHRLDQATSGIMLASKDASTHKALQQQFEIKQIRKTYLALLRGTLHSSCGIIHLPLSVNPDDRPRQVVSHQFGKVATTYYNVISDNPANGIEVPQGMTCVELFPLTGRTHQLRVHCASPQGLDLPIWGDSLYDILDNDSPEDRSNSQREQIPIANRLYLHAARISFQHPVTHQQVTLQRPFDK